MKDVIWAEKIEEPKGSGGELVVHEPDIIKTDSNRVYFYSDINRDSILKLNHKLRERGSAQVAEQIYQGLENPTAIWLHINSFGGSVIHGLSGLDAILTSLVPIHTVVDGCCASAATFLSIAGTKRYIQQNSFMMIHQLSSIAWGKYAELKDQMQNFDVMMKKIKAIYAAHSRVPAEKLDELLEHDLWWDAEQCLEYGLVDEIIVGRNR